MVIPLPEARKIIVKKSINLILKEWFALLQPESISNYGDALSAFYLLTNNDHIFTQIDKGSFIIDADKKLRWSDTKNKRNQSYFYANPEFRKELWVVLDELICHKPN